MVNFVAQATKNLPPFTSTLLTDDLALGVAHTLIPQVVLVIPSIAFQD